MHTLYSSVNCLLVLVLLYMYGHNMSVSIPPSPRGYSLPCRTEPRTTDARGFAEPSLCTKDIRCTRCTNWVGCIAHVHRGITMFRHACQVRSEHHILIPDKYIRYSEETVLCPADPTVVIPEAQNQSIGTSITARETGILPRTDSTQPSPYPVQVAQAMQEV